MQAPTVAETPQIQAMDTARPDQSRDDDRGFAKVLERSLTPARRERPTAVEEQDQPQDKPKAIDADAPAQPADDQTTDVPVESVENAVVQPVVAQPVLTTEIELSLALSGQLPITPDADFVLDAAVPANALPAAGGSAFPLATDLAASGLAQPITTGPTATIPVHADADPALPVAIGTAINALPATDAESALPMTQVVPANDPATAKLAALAGADDDQAMPLAAPVAPTVATGAVSAAPTTLRPSAANTKIANTANTASNDADLMLVDDASTALPVIPTSDQIQSSNVTGQNNPLAAAFVATNAATKPMSSRDDAVAPTAAMPQPTITPTTAPATAAGAALGTQTKAVTEVEDEPIDLQAKSTSSNAPVIAPAAAPSTNAAGQTREAAPATPAALPNPNPMERAVAQQVGRALVQNLPNGERMMVLRLTPPELGTVRIEVIEHQGVMRARLFAEDDGVRLALERTLPLMRQELRASDAPIRELSLTDQSQFQRPDSQDQTQRQQDQQAERRQRHGEGFSLDVARSEPLAAPRIRDLGIRVDASGIDALA